MDGHSELNDDSIENQEVNYQEGATVRDNTIDNNNEDMEQLYKEKYQIYKSDLDAPV